MSPRGSGSWWSDREGPDHTPPAARGKGSRRSYGGTWWGRAWIDALEHRAALDPNRLPRGRSYARRGTVDDLDISPGLVTAHVQGSRAKPYAVAVRVRSFDAEEWNRVLDVAASQLGHAAALLDGEVPTELSSSLADAGVDLLPGPGDVQPRCSCPDWADPCKHSAAVCYSVADALDADPFALLLLRGLSREEVFAGIRSRRKAPSVHGTGTSDAAQGRDRGMLARNAYAARETATIPAPPLPPTRPGRPAALVIDPPLDGPSADELRELATDAAMRAWRLARGDDEDDLALSFDADLARRAAAVLGRAEFVDLARRVGITPTVLAGTAIAWREGRQGGIDVLSTVWTPDTAALEPGREALESSSLPPPTRRHRNRLTRASIQLRLGQDGLWYRLRRSSAGTWQLEGPPDADPQSLVSD